MLKIWGKDGECGAPRSSNFHFNCRSGMRFQNGTILSKTDIPGFTGSNMTDLLDSDFGVGFFCLFVLFYFVIFRTSCLVKRKITSFPT